MTLLTFGVYVLVDENNALDVEKCFVALTLFNIMRVPMSFLPLIIVACVEVRQKLSTSKNKTQKNHQINSFPFIGLTTV